MSKVMEAFVSLTAPDMAREMAMAREICDQRRAAGGSNTLSQSQPQGIPVYLGQGDFGDGHHLHRDPRSDGLRKVMAAQSRLMGFAWRAKRRLCAETWRAETRRLRQHRAVRVRARQERTEVEAVMEKRKVCRTRELEEQVQHAHRQCC